MSEIHPLEILEGILKKLNKTGKIDASAIVSRSGLLICSTLIKNQHAETLVAMSATVFGAAETAAIELEKDLPDRIIIESKHGKLIETGAGPKALLFVMARPDADLGLVLVEMKKASEKIKQVLG
ncbi:MAG TPA: roadblock/LC7 domain-containing protein [Candidatus Methanoperedens sp.]